MEEENSKKEVWAFCPHCRPGHTFLVATEEHPQPHCHNHGDITLSEVIRLEYHHANA